MKALCSDTIDPVISYGEKSPDMSNVSGVHKGWSLTSFLLNFVLDILLVKNDFLTNLLRLDHLSRNLVTDLEYAVELIVFIEDGDKVHRILIPLSKNANIL